MHTQLIRDTLNTTIMEYMRPLPFWWTHRLKFQGLTTCIDSFSVFLCVLFWQYYQDAVNLTGL